MCDKHTKKSKNEAEIKANTDTTTNVENSMFRLPPIDEEEKEESTERKKKKKKTKSKRASVQNYYN